MEELHLVLTGLSGAGKSTVGKLIAHRLGRHFIDTDRQVELTTGLSISELFRSQGEAAFRRHEESAVDTALAQEPAVIAVGGGALLTSASRARARERSMLVWLRVSAEEALQRVSRSEPRPLLNDSPLQRLQTLLQARHESYADCDFSIQTNGLSASQVTAQIISRIEQSTDLIQRRGER